MSRQRPTDFELLKAVWDQKLKDSGFDDIEQPDKWQWHSRYFQARYTPDRFEIHQDYYIMAELFLNSFSFTSRRDLEVWKRHVQGIYPVQISKEIRAIGLKANKDTVYRIIAKLERIMRLGAHL